MSLSKSQIIGTATFTDHTKNSGIVDVSIFNDTATNNGLAVLSGVFTDYAVNECTVEKIAFFSGYSKNNGSVYPANR